MTPVPRLDYSKPPLKYLVHDLNDDGWWWRVDEPEDGCTSPYETEAEAVAAAWAHHKAHNDPPGMRVVGEGGTARAKRPRPARWRIYVLGAVSGYYRETRRLARSEAWDRYDRRLALAGRLVVQFHEDQRPAWPHCLTWPDDQVAEVERKLDGNTFSEWR